MFKNCGQAGSFEEKDCLIIHLYIDSKIHI